MLRTMLAAGLAVAGLATGLYSLAVAQGDPAYSLAGPSAFGGAVLLVAGWALVGTGLAFWVRRPESRFGPLLAAAGFAWFLPEWNNPGVGSALAFTIGLCLYAACPPLVAHAVLAYPHGGLRSRLERGAVVIAYAGGLVVLGLVPAFFFDPQAQSCTQCPRNLVLVADRGVLAGNVTRVGVYVGLAWAIALVLLIAGRLVRASRAERRATAAVLVAGGTYLALVAATFAMSLERGFLSTGTLERRLWLTQAAALVAVAAGVMWGWIRVRRARRAVARLVIDLAASPPPGGLRDVLAQMVGDPSLAVAYVVGPDGQDLVDSQGRSVELPSDRAQTTLVREGHPVALLSHAPGVLDDVQLVDEVAAAGRLALDNERLQAEVHARVEELRASRVRVVEAVDAERKRLERDLHDGAQQRLVGLSLSLRLLRSQVRPDSALDEADAQLHQGIVELRELAHGIFPAVLADDGFAAAVEALTEEARVPIRIRSLPEGRFEPLVETAAYTVVAEAAKAASSGLSVLGERSTGLLLIEVDADGFGDSFDVVGLEDRVGALAGSLAVERSEGGAVTIRAVLPCES